MIGLHLTTIIYNSNVGLSGFPRVFCKKTVGKYYIKNEVQENLISQFLKMACDHRSSLPFNQ